MSALIERLIKDTWDVVGAAAVAGWGALRLAFLQAKQAVEAFFFHTAATPARAGPSSSAVGKGRGAIC